MTVDQIILILTSIGTFLTVGVTFLTVIQIKKQRETSYRPEFVLSRTFFEGTPVAKESLPIFWVRKSESTKTDITSGWFAIHLCNVGLGAAKSVVVSWSFPISELVKEINELAQRTLTPAYFAYENGSLSIKSDKFGNSVSVWENQQTDSIDYVLPVAVQREPVLLKLPHAYIQIASALFFLSSKDKDRKSFPEISVLKVSFEYFDIGERKHHATFEIGLELEALGGSGELIHGCLNPKKLVGRVSREAT